MDGINKAIRKHCENSVRLQEIYVRNDNISYKKSLELQKMQNEEYQKMQFCLKLKKVLLKK